MALMDKTAPLAAAEEGFVGMESPLCDAACVRGLDQLAMVTTASGLQYKDLVVGKGPLPTKGEPRCAHLPEEELSKRNLSHPLYRTHAHTGLETFGGDIPRLLMRTRGGSRLDTRSLQSIPISRTELTTSSHCAFGTHLRGKPCNSRAKLTGESLKAATKRSA
jgi:hypothetical protein